MVVHGWWRYSATDKMQAILDDNDPRLAYTLTSDKKNFVKYVRDGGGDDGGVVTRNNHRILRLADVLLLEAEAVLQSGGSTSEAIGLINQVRTRARTMIAAGTQPADLSTTETQHNYHHAMDHG